MSADLRLECSRQELCALLSVLHRHKDQTYGDAWRRRGELLSIFCNIARKHDRLETAFAEPSVPLGEEKLGDTTGDLAIYVGKYLTWIAERAPDQFEAAHSSASARACAMNRGPAALDAVFRVLLDGHGGEATPDEAWQRVHAAFAELETGLMAQAKGDPADRPSFTEKAGAAWTLLHSSLTLLASLCRTDPDSLQEIPRQIARFDEQTAS